jgi:membrane protease YdiL (CAAX protease family)
MHKPETLPPGISVGNDRGKLATPRTKSPLAYVVLTFVLSIPFWLVGAVTKLQILPSLPVSSLMAVCPLIAAAILVYRENGRAGVIELLKRSFDFKRVRDKIWYVPTILLMPGIMIGSYIALRLMGVQLPDPQFSFTTILILFVVFFIAAIGEEVGWSGYAIDPLQDRYGALAGALLLGGVWAVWHIIPLLSVPRSLAWIAWWSLGTVASRVIITWLYNNTGRSVFIAILFHAMINITYMLFPIDGSSYDPRITGLIMTFMVIIIVGIWRPQTLVRESRR